MKLGAWAGTMTCALSTATTLWAADDPPDEPKESEAEGPDHRIGLALGLNGTNASNGPAGAGTLGSVSLGALVPSASAGYEARLAGPLWLVIRAHGSFSESEDVGGEASTWFVGGSAGVRVEVPVVDRVDVGGHALLDGWGGQSRWNGFEGSVHGLGGIAGASVHFHPTPVFGVRLVLDVLHVGWSHQEMSGYETEHVAARLRASPAVELTFSF